MEKQVFGLLFVIALLALVGCATPVPASVIPAPLATTASHAATATATPAPAPTKALEWQDYRIAVVEEILGTHYTPAFENIKVIDEVENGKHVKKLLLVPEAYYVNQIVHWYITYQDENKIPVSRIMMLGVKGTKKYSLPKQTIEAVTTITGIQYRFIFSKSEPAEMFGMLLTKYSEVKFVTSSATTQAPHTIDDNISARASPWPDTNFADELYVQ